MKMLFKNYFTALCLMFFIATVFISVGCGRKNVEAMPPKQSLEVSEPTKIPIGSSRENNNQNMNGTKSTTDSTENWGATGIAVVVEENSVKIEFDCAFGEIKEKLTINKNGEFKADGTFTRESFGPIRDDNMPKPQPARYEGKISGDMMTLKVTLTEKKETIGDYTLERDKFARLRKCQ
ncbi:hypothetical protein BH20ACI1_BH20ACI1_21610 [soil metagenome]